MTTDKVKAKLEFLGMKKIIEISQGTEKYKIALPVTTDTASNVHGTGKETIPEQFRYVSLLFTAESNYRYGLPGEPEICFTFDHVDIEDSPDREGMKQDE